MCTLTAAERMILLVALLHEEQKLRSMIADCEALPEKDRVFPTDRPEKWRSELETVLTLRQKLSGSGYQDLSPKGKR